MSGTRAPLPDPLEIYLLAHSFESANGILGHEMRLQWQERPGGDLAAAAEGIEPRDLAPVVILDAFGLELYLKCLLVIEGKVPRKEHDHRKLFALLSAPTQREVRQHHERLVESNPSIREFIEAGHPRSHFQLDEVLRQCGNAFTSWRYLYERPDRELIHYTGCVREAVKAVILKSRPEWAD